MSVSTVVLRTRQGFSLRVRRRSVLVVVLLAVVLFGLVVVGLATGDFPVPWRDAVSALFGGDGGNAFIVRALRAPRVLLAVLVGAAFGASGAIFQSLTANPLGSPDVIGFTMGAATGGIFAILVLDGTAVEIALCSVFFGLAVAGVVYALAYRGGGVQPFRLVLVGLGAGYAVLSVNDYLISRAPISDGLVAERWLIGSVSQADWTVVRSMAVALLVLLPGVALLSRSLLAMEVGDDTSRAIGVRLQVARPLLALAGVALAAVGTATAGPVSFVAFTAPQIGRRLTRAPGPNVAVSTVTGAVLLLAADQLAQRLPTPLPVGLVTGLLGGGYLTWLLYRSIRP